MNVGAYVKAVGGPEHRRGWFGTVTRVSPTAGVIVDFGGTLGECWMAKCELEVISEDVGADTEPTEPDVAGRDLDTTNPKDALGVKKAPLRFVPPALRILAAPAMALGAQKYGPYNWREKQVRLSVYLEAIDRHLAAYWDGEDLDPESGHTHLSHVAACLGIIADAQEIGKLVDDRPVRGAAPAILAALDQSGR